MQRPRRRNERGEWRCCTCKVYQRPENFSFNRATNAPDVYCRPCRAAYQRAIYNRKALDADWWRREQERLKPIRKRLSERRRADRRERAALAQTMLAGLRRKGLSKNMVWQVAGVGDETQRRIERGAELSRGHVLDRLVRLHLACQELPELSRGGGSRRHPAYDAIQARYRTLERTAVNA